MRPNRPRPPLTPGLATLRHAAMVMVLPGLLLAACEPLPATPVPAAPADECGASGYQGLIGQPQQVVAGMNFPLDTRVIGPQDMVTADFRPDRLNIEYGPNGRITTVSCF